MPRDWTYIGLLVLGAGILIPWNALVSASDYFEYRYPGRHSDRLFTVCYLPVQLVTLLLLSWQHAWADRHVKLRITAGYGGFTAVMVLVVLVEAASVGSSGFTAILLAVGVTGVLDGLAQGAIFGEYSQLPAEYTQAIVTGTAISGTAVSLLRVITKAAFADSPRGLQFGACELHLVLLLFLSNLSLVAWRPETLFGTADLYFVIAAVLCLCCALVYTRLLPAQPLIQQCSARDIPKARSSADLDSDHELEMPAMHGLPAAAVAEGIPEAEALGQDSLLAREEVSEPLGLKGVLRHTRLLTLSLLVIYTVTLAIFPGFLVEDVHSAELGSWYPVLLIAGFNVCDLIGKSLPLRGPLVAGGPAITLASSMARLAFVPAFLLTAMLGASPAVVALLSAALGVSNGFLTSAAMVAATQGLRAEADRRLAGNLAVLALVAGLSVGAGCGFLWLL